MGIRKEVRIEPVNRPLYAFYGDHKEDKGEVVAVLRVEFWHITIFHGFDESEKTKEPPFTITEGWCGGWTLDSCESASNFIEYYESLSELRLCNHGLQPTDFVIKICKLWGAE